MTRRQPAPLQWPMLFEQTTLRPIDEPEEPDWGRNDYAHPAEQSVPPYPDQELCQTDDDDITQTDYPNDEVPLLADPAELRNAASLACTAFNRARQIADDHDAAFDPDTDDPETWSPIHERLEDIAHDAWLAWTDARDAYDAAKSQ